MYKQYFRKSGLICRCRKLAAFKQAGPQTHNSKISGNFVYSWDVGILGFGVFSSAFSQPAIEQSSTSNNSSFKPSFLILISARTY